MMKSIARRWICCCGFAATVVQWPISANAASDGAAKFAVATIKPSTPDEFTRVVLIQGNRLTATAGTVIDLMKYAYGVHPSQVVGGPEWMRTQRFDIVADPETEKRPSSDEFKAMVQGLLAERFHLTWHAEQKELPVFVLVKGKSGPKLTETKDKPEGLPWVSWGPGMLTAHNAATIDLTKFLQRYVTDKPVLDKTGVAGRYDMELRWAPDEGAAMRNVEGGGQTAAELPSLYTAIQEQLGLRLEAKKQQVPVMAIDKAEMPGEN
jgi:uncharacterized protein (TIGR03435 family)